MDLLTYYKDIVGDAYKHDDSEKPIRSFERGEPQEIRDRKEKQHPLPRLTGTRSQAAIRPSRLPPGTKIRTFEALKQELAANKQGRATQRIARGFGQNNGASMRRMVKNDSKPPVAASPISNVTSEPRVVDYKEVEIVFSQRQKRKGPAGELDAITIRKLQNGILEDPLNMRPRPSQDPDNPKYLEQTSMLNALSKFGPVVQMKPRGGGRMRRREPGDGGGERKEPVWGFKLPPHLEGKREGQERAAPPPHHPASDTLGFHHPVIRPGPGRFELPALSMFPGRIEQMLGKQRDKSLQLMYQIIGKADGLKAGIKIHRGQHRDIRRFIKFATPDHLKEKSFAIPADTDGEKNSLYLYVVQELVRVTQAYAEGHYQASLESGKILMQVCAEAEDGDIPKHWEIIGTLCSIIGNSHLELGNDKKAVAFHKQDMRLGQAYDIQEATARSLENLGRTYAKMGQYNQAINVWQLNVPLPGKRSEKAWLCHEIGSCYLETESYPEAADYGEASLMLAVQADDDKWQLNAIVLIAQAALRSGDIMKAYETFQKGYDLAVKNGDDEAIGNISGALDGIKDALLEMNE